MAEYIEREALLAKQFDCNYLSDAAPLMVVDVEDIEAAPAADVVKVVRCNECEHRGKDAWCAYVDEDDNFFCGRGERRADG